ncbi:aconitase family protein [Rhodobacteraceae bacterium D3-12]|nr:aconitase family protein [Rhodobacteraceae bacterium D3-12]
MSIPPATLSEKILARASGRDSVRPGEIVMVSVDLAMMHDSGGPRRVKPMLEQLGAQVWNPDKIVVVSDHFVPAVDADSAAILDLTRKWVKETQIRRFYDMKGICHVVLPENGLIQPGMMAVGGDSHSCTGGAWGAFMVGMGATDMLGVLVTGETWLRVPTTVRFRCDGRLPRGVSAKDIMLHLCATVDPVLMSYRTAEYCGEAVSAMSMPERMTLCNMSAELGAKTGLIAPDATTRAWLERFGVGVGPLELQADPDAEIEREVVIDTPALAPQVAAPHSPANTHPVGACRGQRITQAYIGACTGAKLEGTCTWPPRS